MNEAKWKRSSRGNLFLQAGDRRKQKVACVFKDKEGTGFGFWMAGGDEQHGLPTEEAAVDALYKKLGWQQ
jgi:hypothetical protein